MPGSEYKTASCLFCDWNNRTHFLPHHMISHHPEKVAICDVQNNHCLRGYVTCKKVEVFFAVCLTCKKGTTTETYGGNGARWMNLHSKKEACRAAHATAFAAFKALQAGLTDASSAVVPPPAPVGESLETVWSRIKEDARVCPALVEIEERFRADFDDDSENEDGEFTLNVLDALKQIARNALGFKKEMERQKAIVHDHESRLQLLEMEMKQARQEKESLRKQNESMLAELKTLREMVAEKHMDE